MSKSSSRSSGSCQLLLTSGPGPVNSKVPSPVVLHSLGRSSHSMATISMLNKSSWELDWTETHPLLVYLNSSFLWVIDLSYSEVRIISGQNSVGPMPGLGKLALLPLFLMLGTYHYPTSNMVQSLAGSFVKVRLIHPLSLTDRLSSCLMRGSQCLHQLLLVRLNL